MASYIDSARILDARPVLFQESLDLFENETSFEDLTNDILQVIQAIRFSEKAKLSEEDFNQLKRKLDSLIIQLPPMEFEAFKNWNLKQIEIEIQIRKIQLHELTSLSRDNLTLIQFQTIKKLKFFLRWLKKEKTIKANSQISELDTQIGRLNEKLRLHMLAIIKNENQINKLLNIIDLTSRPILKVKELPFQALIDEIDLLRKEITRIVIDHSKVQSQCCILRSEKQRMEAALNAQDVLDQLLEEEMLKAQEINQQILSTMKSCLKMIDGKIKNSGMTVLLCKTTALLDEVCLSEKKGKFESAILMKKLAILSRVERLEGLCKIRTGAFIDLAAEFYAELFLFLEGKDLQLLFRVFKEGYIFFSSSFNIAQKVLEGIEKIYITPQEGGPSGSKQRNIKKFLRDLQSSLITV